MRIRTLITVSTVSLAVAAAAWAVIPDASGVIHACYAVKGGGLRVVDGTSCKTGEVALSWNQTGRPGPAGPSG